MCYGQFIGTRETILNLVPFLLNRVLQPFMKFMTSLYITLKELSLTLNICTN